MRARTVTMALGATGLVLAAAVVAGQYAGGGTTAKVPAASAPVTPAPSAPLTPGTATSAARAGQALPKPDHVVIVVEENHASGEVIGAAPYLTRLAKSGADFTRSYAVAHPSQPNYLALFSGSTQGVTNDSCPHRFGTGNLGAQLITAGATFAGYSESMPSDGYTGCAARPYARKHSPWIDFTNLPATTNLRFTRFPADYTRLPTLSFVIPDLDHDAHDGTVAQADAWLQTHLDGYARWAATHNSLLIVTFDEDDSSDRNRIPTVFSGPMVATGAYPERMTHYSVLRTIEDMYGLPCLGGACSAIPITDVWR